MKTRIIQGIHYCVCKGCEDPFIVGEKFIIHGGIEVVDYVDFYEGVKYPYPQRGTRILTNTEYYHEDCFLNTNKPLPTLDALKETINHLTKEERRSLYSFLYNAHGCRI